LGLGVAWLLKGKLIDVVYGAYAGAYAGGCRVRVRQHSLQAARLLKPRIPKIQKFSLQ
jgi:hypothetical protein